MTVKIYASVKAWHPEREEVVTLDHNGDLDIQRVESLLGYSGQFVCKVSTTTHLVILIAHSSSHCQT